MLFKSSTEDFYWDNLNDEPHATRRKQILAKYPQIKKLMGHDWREAVQVVSMVIVQIIAAYLLRNCENWYVMFAVAYVLGGTFNHSLSISLHEISHNLAFGQSRYMLNRLLGFVANLPLGVPASITFKKYHTDHHRFLGINKMDPDLPTEFEVRLFSSTLGKILYVSLLSMIYSLRPIWVIPKPVTRLEVANTAVQIAFDAAIYYFFGWRALAYLGLSTLLGLGLHPVSGHFIAEHYVFIKGYETYSYYGPLNFLTFNVGYHNEHHDFPNVPGYRLPEITKIAPEFYQNRPCHYSWMRVLWDFITCDDMGPYSRIKRKPKL